MKKVKLHSSEILDNFFKVSNQPEDKKTAYKMIIAARIDDAIKRKGLSQKEFALIMNKTSSEISKWLSGHQNFTIGTLIEIEHYLGVEILNPKPIYCNPCNYKSLINK